MKTDVIEITANGTGFTRVLEETERAAAYRGLEPKQALRLRLLAEEMTGMLKTLVGDERFRYWIESEGRAFSLHLETQTIVTRALREALLKASSSGKNAAAKGFMGRLREILTTMSESYVPAAIAEMGYGYSYVNVIDFDASMDMSPNAMLYGWSLRAYRDAVTENKEKEPEKWDELEKSITAKLADDVKIFIRGNNVEMVIEKTF
jgi:small nuclear ribonucleoprotein (snRNP)-like protein